MEEALPPPALHDGTIIIAPQTTHVAPRPGSSPAGPAAALVTSGEHGATAPAAPVRGASPPSACVPACLMLAATGWLLGDADAAWHGLACAAPSVRQGATRLESLLEIILAEQREQAARIGRLQVSHAHATRHTHTLASRLTSEEGLT
jgi:hypothetical protein